MATRSTIAYECKETKKVYAVYCHSDGYLEYNGAMLDMHYSTYEKAKELVSLGGISSIREKANPDPSRPHKFGYKTNQEDVTVAYHRDRGDEPLTIREYENFDEYIADSGNFQEFDYIFLQEKWFVHSSYLRGTELLEVKSLLHTSK